jgi:D-alanine-D-alanine ligase
MVKKIAVALIYGGISEESEVSQLSAKSVLMNLNPEVYDVLPIAILKNGDCYCNDYQELFADTNVSLPLLGQKAQKLPGLIRGGRFILDVDVVFPIMHGRFYEDGCIQGLLEMVGVSYVGAGVMTSAIAMDKDIQRRLVCDDNIKSVKYKVISDNVSWLDADDYASSLAALVQGFKFPLFVKPCNQGSSVGVTKVRALVDLKSALILASKHSREILIEEGVDHAREIEIAVLENIDDYGHPLVSKPAEIIVTHKDGFYSYDAKYVDTSCTSLDFNPVLPDNVSQNLRELAKKIFLQLKCRGMARVDFLIDKNNNALYFNEVNTLPGFTALSMYPLLWQANGLPYADLLDKLLALSMPEFKNKMVPNGT